MKPKHLGGYTEAHTDLCERTLATLLRGLGPWKEAVYLVGGLVPRFLIPHPSGGDVRRPHAGTTDVDLVLNLEVLAGIEAYRKLEANLKALGFVRGTNEEGQVQHHSWRMHLGDGITVVVDLLCDAALEEGGRIAGLPKAAGNVSALRIPGAGLAARDFVEHALTGELLDGRGTATVTVRVANVVPFVVLKALAYEDRFEEKDAYDLVYTLMYYPSGPDAVAASFAQRLRDWPDEALLPKALEILRERFATDGQTEGYRKDGPRSYARFQVDPGRTDLAVRHQRDAAAVVERFLASISNGVTMENGA